MIFLKKELTVFLTGVMFLTRLPRAKKYSSW